MLVFGLGACSSLAVRAPEPTPAWIPVFYSQGWQPLLPTLAECTPSGSALAYQDTPEQAVAVLAWGGTPPEGWSAFQLGEESLEVIVHPRSTARSISSTGLRLVYTDEIRDWDFLGQAPGPIAAWGFPSSAEAAQIARSAGVTISSASLLVPAPAEMRAAVAADPTSIGLLPGRYLDSSVRRLEINDLDPKALQAPLLAFTPGEPQGSLRAWLFCLQERLNR